MAYKNFPPKAPACRTGRGQSILIVGGIALILSLLFYQNSLAYNPETTHKDLTREIITFYELSTGKKFTDEQKKWIIFGSIEEDKSPRWLNHFYDPVFERGLQTESVGISGYLAKNWAQFSSYQTISPSNIGNLWTGKGPVISGSWWGDFSYEAAIKEYSKSKEKESYIALGHILHLIEDITVPEHTRNDSHPGGPDSSNYEIWAKYNSSGLTQDLGKRIYNQGKKPVIYSDLESYFNNLATYTNNHFFSPRTINSKLYQKPKIVFEDGTFAYGQDENDEFFDIAIIQTDIKSGIKSYLIKDDNYQVLQEYWLRLSRQAIINGAGVIELFLTEAEKAKEAEIARQELERRQVAEKSSFLSQIFNFFKSPEAPSSEPALVIKSESTKPKIAKQETAVKQIEIKKPEIVQPKPAPAPIPTLPTPNHNIDTPTSPSASVKTAPQNQELQTNAPIVYGGGGGGGSSSAPTQQNNQSTNQPTTQETNSNATSTNNNLNISIFKAGDLVINEIMYDLEGSDTTNGKSREWIELYNKSEKQITLTGGNSGWRFNDSSNHLLNEPAAQGSMAILAGGYVILAGDATTFLADHSGFSGAVIDTVMSLKNTSATLKISAPDGTIIDEVSYISSWGANGNGKTLERKSASGGSSDSANWAQSSAPGGTPGAANNWELAATSSPPVVATSTLEMATSTLSIATSTELVLKGFGTDVPATTTISVNTTWTLAGSPYRLFFDSQRRPTVAAGATLTISPGVKIIPQSGGATALEIQGTLNAIATSGAPIIFTSIADADSDNSTVPQKGDWLNIDFSQGSQANLDYVEFRYGGGQDIILPLHEMVNILGANVNISNSKFENSKHTALHLVDSLGTVQNSVFSDNDCGISIDSANGVANVSYSGCYGIHTTGQILSAAPQILNNQFIRNQNIAIEVRSGTAPTIGSNVFTDNGYPIKIESSYPAIVNSQILNSPSISNVLNGIAISGYTHFSQNYTLKKDLPYILETNGPALSPYVDTGAILTLEPGTILKSNNISPTIFVYGNLVASTTPDNPIVFTSLKDDSRGGDTNGDASTSSAQNGDWSNIKFLTGSIGNFVNSIFSYGGFGYVGPAVSATSTAPFISIDSGATVVVQ